MLQAKLLLSRMSHSHVFGIQADIPLHFFSGLLLYTLLVKLNWKASRMWICILMVALAKEVFDASAILKSTLYLEPVKDIFVTLMGSYCYRYLPILHLDTLAESKRSNPHRS